MRKEQFEKAFAIANSNADLTNVDDSAMFGYALPDFEPVTVPIETVAKTLRWQALQLSGKWDTMELEACRKAFVHPSRKVEVFGEFICPHCGEKVLA
jgi:hypothetical protein